MNTPHIQTAHPLGQTPPNVYDDFDWIRQHEQELFEQYGECSIIVYEQKVIGVGATYSDALEDAERNLPSDFRDTITPVHQWLRPRQPFFRVRPVQSKNDE